MKRTFFAIAVACSAALVSFAQNSKIYKAGDLLKEENLKEALAAINEAVENPKTKNMALAYFLKGEIQSRIVNNELQKVGEGTCDSTLFIKALDDAIESFTKSHEYDAQPDKNGKVKLRYANKFQTVGAEGNSGHEEYPGYKKRITEMLKYFGQSASFELKRENKASALKYLVKDLELPKNPVFTKAETDSIYKKDQAHYNQIGYFVAMIYNEDKDYDNVLKYVDYAVGDQRSMRDGYQMKATALLAKGDTATWVGVCKQAIQDMPDNVNYCQNLLKYYDDRNAKDEATAMAKELVEKNPDNKVAWYASGCVKMNSFKQYAAARADFDKAIEKDPEFVEALYNKGVSYVNELISMNLTTDTRSEDYKNTLEKAKEYYGNALPLFEKVRELAPDKKEYWAENLRSCYYNLDMQDKAKEMEAIITGN